MNQTIIATKSNPVENKSRSEKRKHKLEIIDNDQFKISEFFPLLNKMQILINQNNELKRGFENFQKNYSSSVSNDNQSQKNNFLHDLLKLSMSEKKTNITNDSKSFASFLYIIGGRYLYEILYANLKLPSPSTVLNFIRNKGPPIING